MARRSVLQSPRVTTTAVSTRGSASLDAPAAGYGHHPTGWKEPTPGASRPSDVGLPGPSGQGAPSGQSAPASLLRDLAAPRGQVLAFEPEQVQALAPSPATRPTPPNAPHNAPAQAPHHLSPESWLGAPEGQAPGVATGTRAPAAFPSAAVNAAPYSAGAVPQTTPQSAPPYAGAHAGADAADRPAERTADRFGLGSNTARGPVATFAATDHAAPAHFASAGAPARGRRTSTASRWLRCYGVFRVVALVASAVVVGAAVLGLLAALVTGLRAVPVTDADLGGAVSSGSLAVVRPTPASELRPGDVISLPQGLGPGWSSGRIRAIRDAGQGAFEVELGADATPSGGSALVIRDAAKHQFAVPVLGVPAAFFASAGGRLVGWLLFAMVLAVALLPPGRLTGRT